MSNSDEYDEYEPIGRSPRRGSPLALAAVALLAVGGITVASLLVWASRQMNPSGGPGEKVASISIPSGSTFSDVATILEKEEVVTSASVLGWYAKFNDVPTVRAGRYVNFRKNSSMADAVDVLDAGPVPPQALVVQIIPGMWLSDALIEITEVFPAITPQALEQALASGAVTSKYHPDPTASWEGYLLPETYQFDEAATPTEILQKIVTEFDDTLDGLGYANAQAARGRTAAELVTIASMIERETGDPPEERAMIAAVIFNRLERGTPLGIDATFMYGLGRRGNDKPLTKSELAADGPYNSRLRKGLPPTAISLPSMVSLAAAIAPAEGDWIYYVLKSIEPRAHVFTASAKEFERAKAECRKNGFC